MIVITRDKTQVEFQFNPDMPNDHVMVLRWECRDEWYAILLTQRCKDRLHNELHDIRKESYNQGWKDAKSHKAVKRTWFSRYF